MMVGFPCVTRFFGVLSEQSEMQQHDNVIGKWLLWKKWDYWIDWEFMLGLELEWLIVCKGLNFAYNDIIKFVM